jgi:hypothetical protein
VILNETEGWSYQGLRGKLQSHEHRSLPVSSGLHLRGLLNEWVTLYNGGRPHSSLGPGIPDSRFRNEQAKPCGLRLPIGHRVVAKPILGGLHHEYGLKKRAA